MDDEKRTARDKVSEGIRQGIGVLSAFKDALEETITEARERGDLSPEKARGVMKEALHKAQAAAEGARERLDFVHQSEFDTLSGAVASLADRVRALEEHLGLAAKEPGDGGAGAP